MNCSKSSYTNEFYFVRCHFARGCIAADSAWLLSNGCTFALLRSQWSSSILVKLLHIRIVISPASISLAWKVTFHWILAEYLTKKVAPVELIRCGASSRKDFTGTTITLSNIIIFIHLSVKYTCDFYSLKCLPGQTHRFLFSFFDVAAAFASCSQSLKYPRKSSSSHCS